MWSPCMFLIGSGIHCLPLLVNFVSTFSIVIFLCLGITLVCLQAKYEKIVSRFCVYNLATE